VIPQVEDGSCVLDATTVFRLLYFHVRSMTDRHLVVFVKWLAASPVA